MAEVGWDWYWEAVSGLVEQSTVFSVSTRTPIASTDSVWVSTWTSLLGRKIIQSGLTRFRLVDGNEGFVVGPVLNPDTKEAWLSQALSVFHGQGLSLDDDLSDYALPLRGAWLEWNLSEDLVHRQRRSAQPIFLFVRLPQSTLPRGHTSSLHYWSFEEDGQIPLPSETCDDLGLPTDLLFKDNHGYRNGRGSLSWDPEVYRSIDQYQRLRGFDPTTTDFARYLGFAVFRTIDNQDRLDEAHDHVADYAHRDESDVEVPGESY
ncbi:hypothetical protein PM082_006444 [Marasmius tenuissimus]|nr:hypothetical protein PM082_006444 [Marasmius tenuissimus]